MIKSSPYVQVEETKSGYRFEVAPDEFGWVDLAAFTCDEGSFELTFGCKAYLAFAQEMTEPLKSNQLFISRFEGIHQDGARQETDSQRKIKSKQICALKRYSILQSFLDLHD